MNRPRNFFIGVLVFLACVIAMLVFIFGVVKDRLEKGLLENYKKQEILIADRVTTEFKLEADHIRRQLVLIAKQPEVRYGSGNEQKCNQALKDIKDQLLTNVNNLGRVGADGRFACSLNSALVGFQANQLGPYIDEIFNDPEHKPVMSRTIKPPGIPGYAVAAHVPVFDANSKFIGTLGGAIYLDDLYAQFLEKISFAQRGFVVVLDDDGTVIYHPHTELIAKNIESAEFAAEIGQAAPFREMVANAKLGLAGSAEYVTIKDGLKIGTYKPVEIWPGRHWVVLVTVPVKDATVELASVGVSEIIGGTSWVMILIITISALGLSYSAKKLVFDPMIALDRTKDEFISTASHQLRTPLGSMRWIFEVLRTDFTLPKEVSENLAVAYESNLRVIRLVGDLLNVARIDQGRVKDEPQKVAVAGVIEGAMKEMEPEANGKSITMSLDKGVGISDIVIDPIRFREVIQNLVSNAVKYTSAGGKVSVRIVDKNADVLISIEDNGIGIPDKERGKIFKKFSRADNAIGAGDGTGLGLYIVKSFVDGWGGKIWFESQERKGTTFYLLLPKVVKLVKQKHG